MDSDDDNTLTIGVTLFYEKNGEVCQRKHNFMIFNERPSYIANITVHDFKKRVAQAFGVVHSEDIALFHSDDNEELDNYEELIKSSQSHPVQFIAELQMDK
jgi:hypothetical protein